MFDLQNFEQYVDVIDSTRNVGQDFATHSRFDESKYHYNDEDGENEDKKEDIPNSFEELIDFLQDTAKQFRYSATRTHALRVAYEEMQESIPKKNRRKRVFSLYCITCWHSIVDLLAPFYENRDILKEKEVIALTHPIQLYKKKRQQILLIFAKHTSNHLWFSFCIVASEILFK